MANIYKIFKYDIPNQTKENVYYKNCCLATVLECVEGVEISKRIFATPFYNICHAQISISQFRGQGVTRWWVVT